jgi:hypothetical protein
MLGTLLNRWDVALCRSACGLLASFGLGMRLIPLLGAWLRQVAEDPYGGHGSEELRGLVRFVHDNITALNGSAWHEEQFPAVSLQLVSLQLVSLQLADASKRGAGAHVCKGLQGGWQAAIPFDARVLQAGFSSTKCEVLAQRLALQELLHTHRAKMQRKQIQVWCDNQAAVADCQRMRGTWAVLEEVRQLYLLAWEHDIRQSEAAISQSTTQPTPPPISPTPTMQSTWTASATCPTCFTSS